MDMQLTTTSIDTAPVSLGPVRTVCTNTLKLKRPTVVRDKDSILQAITINNTTFAGFDLYNISIHRTDTEDVMEVISTCNRNCDCEGTCRMNESILLSKSDALKLMADVNAALDLMLMEKHEDEAAYEALFESDESYDELFD